MTGEHQNRDDEHEEIEDLAADDASFVLEDWDELDQVLAEVEQEVGKRPDDRALDEVDPENQLFVVDDDLDAAASADDEIESPEDLLFRPTGPRERESEFSETEQTQWAGDALDAEAIGIPVEAPVGHEIGADEATLLGDLAADDEVQEVELDVGEDFDFRGESGFFRAEGKGAEGKWESAGAQEEIPAESQEFVEGGEDWAPYDPETAEQEPEPEAAEEFEGEEVHISSGPGLAHDSEGAEAEYAEQYAQSDWAPARVRRRGVALRIAGAAAMLLVAAGVGTVLYRPEWLGLKPPAVVIDRTEVARPKLELALAAPSHDLGAGAGDPSAVTDPLLAGGDPELPPIPVGDPLEPPTPTPDTTPPELPPVAIGGEGDTGGPPETEPSDPGAMVDLGAEPGEEGLVVIDGGVRATEKAKTQQRDLVAVGDELRVGGQVAAEGAEPETPHAMAAGLIVGDHAYAQLTNGNFFVGNVKRFDSEVVTLRVSNGEITLPFAEIRGFGTVDSPKYRELMRSQPGFIRLNNTNRLKGSIVLGADGDVTLGGDTSRIVIPKTEVKEVNESLPAGIRVEDDENDEEWIQQLIERRLEKRRAAEEERGREGATEDSFIKEQQLPQPPK
jgi:hypothetical protein